MDFVFLNLDFSKLRFFQVQNFIDLTNGVDVEIIPIIMKSTRSLNNYLKDYPKKYVNSSERTRFESMF